MEPRLRHYALVAPVQALLLAAIVLPSAYVFYLSLTQSSYGADPRFVGWINYANVLLDPYFWRAFVNTVVVVNVIVFGELVLALLIALLFIGEVPARKLMIAVVLAPYAISEVVAVVMWKFMMEPYAGPVTLFLRGLGLPELEWAINPAHGLGLVILLSIWHHLPFTFVILYTARLGIPRELYEAAAVDGARAWQQFRFVTLPLLLPAILVALLFRTIFALRIFSEVWLLTGGGPARETEVLAVYLYRLAFRYADFGAASATGWLMVVISLLMGLYYLRQMYKRMFAYEA